jgi:hypothetical protein
MKKIITPILLLLLSTAAFSQKKATSAKAELQILENYINVKNSLLVSDKLNTAKGADSISKMVATLKNNKSKSVKVQTALDSIGTYSAQIAAISDINKQRKLFSNLSTAVWQLAENVSNPKEVLYLQVCPMTKESWVSKETVIKNPYYPKNMLDCGAVKGQTK